MLILKSDRWVRIQTVTAVAKATCGKLLGREVSILWIDAHADINTTQSSAGGGIHEMSVEFSLGLTKPSSEEPSGYIKKCDLINLERVV